MDSSTAVDVAVLIPAWRPSAALVQFVERLVAQGMPAIVIVDDGSGPEYQEAFSQVAALPNVHLLRHAVRLGKGAALKTGMNYALCSFAGLGGIVTADADGGCSVEDIETVAARVRQSPPCLIVARGPRPRGFVFEAMNDSGLRGIPASLASRLLTIESQGDEFDIEMRRAALRLRMPTVELPIRDGEASRVPHSRRRYAALIRFGAASLLPVVRANAVGVLVVLILIGVLGVEIHGFRATHLFQQEYWMPIGLRRLRNLTAGYMAYAGPLLLLVPWVFPAVVVALTGVLTVVAVGVLPLIAAIFYLLSANALGSRLLGFSENPSLDAQVGSTLLGISAYVFVMELVARLPVHYTWIYVVLLALPLVAERRRLGRRIRSSGKALYNADFRGWGERAACALLVFMLVLHWLVALKPETTADALAMHLAIPANIAGNHQLTYQPSRFLWAVMPMGADFSYTIAYLLGGEAASRLVNFAMLLAIVALLYSAVRRWSSPMIAFLTAACFVSTPLVQLVTGGLFVENQLTALVLGATAALWRLADTGERRYLYLMAALAGCAAATKLGALSFVAFALPFLAIALWRHRKSLAKVTAGRYMALLLFLMTAAPPYWTAWRLTGNPLFPFMNKRFQSALLGPTVDIRDMRFHHPIRWTVPYELTFESNHWWEGSDGSFGFQYLLLIPLALVAAGAVARFPVISAAAMGLGGGFLVLITEPNIRYLYPAMALLLIPFGALLGALRASRQTLYRALILSTVGSTMLNAYFLPASSYYHRDFYVRFSAKAREDYITDATPTRRLIAYLNAKHPRAPVLFTESTQIAGLPGEVYELNWHQLSVLERIRQAPDVDGLKGLIADWRIRYIITSKIPVPDASESPALNKFLQFCTLPEFESGAVYLARVEPTCEIRQTTAKPGVYDDFSRDVFLEGPWVASTQFKEAFNRTISYSKAPRAQAKFAFEGSRLTYLFTKAFNRGWAQVEIDGRKQKVVDLYSSRIEWQSRATFDGLGPGRHVAVIRPMLQHSPGSTDTFIDVDGFEVEK